MKLSLVRLGARVAVGRRGAPGVKPGSKQPGTIVNVERVRPRLRCRVDLDSGRVVAALNDRMSFISAPVFRDPVTLWVHERMYDSCKFRRGPQPAASREYFPAAVSTTFESNDVDYIMDLVDKHEGNPDDRVFYWLIREIADVYAGIEVD